MVLEVKAVIQDSKEVIHRAKVKHNEHVRQLTLKIKLVKKLSMKEMNAAKEKHTDEVAKLERDKSGLRDRKQRKEYKDKVKVVEGQHEALEN